MKTVHGGWLLLEMQKDVKEPLNSLSEVDRTLGIGSWRGMQG
jgi:hypothetical protein